MTSLIVITLRRAELLRNTLAALQRQTRPPDEVVIVDNGPVGETEKVAREAGARYVAEPRRGYGSARNRGLAEARGEVHQAISIVKKRGSEHERTIREFRLDKGGIRIGEPLREFRGVLTGVPTYEGKTDSLIKDEAKP